MKFKDALNQNANSSVPYVNSNTVLNVKISTLAINALIMRINNTLAASNAINVNQL